EGRIRGRRSLHHPVGAGLARSAATRLHRRRVVASVLGGRRRVRTVAARPASKGTRHEAGAKNRKSSEETHHQPPPPLSWGAVPASAGSPTSPAQNVYSPAIGPP